MVVFLGVVRGLFRLDDQDRNAGFNGTDYFLRVALELREILFATGLANSGPRGGPCVSAGFGLFLVHENVQDVLAAIFCVSAADSLVMTLADRDGDNVG